MYFDSAEEFNKWVLRQILLSGKSQREVAIGAGVHYMSLYNWTHGSAGITLNNAIKIAKYFGYRIGLVNDDCK